MKSMTGYGKARLNREGIDLEFEIKSLNGRYLDLRLYLPRELSFFEYPIRQKAAEFLGRGTIEVRASFTDHREPELQLNEVKLKKYYDIVRKAAKLLSLQEEIPLEFLLAEPGVIETADNLSADPDLQELLGEALDLALADLQLKLQAEGEQIKEVLRSSVLGMLDILDQIEAEIVPYKEELLSSMKNRTLELLSSNSTDSLEQRLIQELALFIDKYDVQEELTRLRSHIFTLIGTLEQSGDCGKGLNFILQELQREANTLGSKFSTAQTFKHILRLKEDVEKCREMEQNVA